MTERIRLTIDGRTVEVDKGTTVLQAAGGAGIEVPRYCYHPGLTIAGNCRICLVEIEKMPKLATSCTTVAADGMVVRTTGPKVADGRRAVMEFLLANHPLDCPICDQAGECWLQIYAFTHGSGVSRMEEERLKGFKQKPVGPHVVLDTERCIVCTRCVRFCQEVTGTGELGVFQRGVSSYIDIFPGRQLDNPYSGCTVDICPVGALTLEEFRFRKRVWDLEKVPSVCGSCARGCNVDIGLAGDRIWRLTPRENQAVNQWWMCDVGRLSHESLYATPRLKEALLREGGKSEPAPWPAAVELLAGKVKQARKGAVAVVASASLTVEDLYMIRRLFAEMPDLGEIIVPERILGADDALLIRADKTANAAGARLLGLELDAGGRRQELALEAAAGGRIDVLILIDNGVPAVLPPAAPMTAAAKNAFVCMVTPFMSGAVEIADLALPAAAWGEFDGTWVNFQGRAQRVRRAVAPPGVALEGWRVIHELMRGMGFPSIPTYSGAADVLAEIAREVPAFKGITRRGIGRLGVQVAG